MRSELKLAPHAVRSGSVVEVWFGGELVAAVYPADGPGVRVISKRMMTVVESQEPTPGVPGVVSVLVSSMAADPKCEHCGGFGLRPGIHGMVRCGCVSDRTVR